MVACKQDNPAVVTGMVTTAGHAENTGSRLSGLVEVMGLCSNPSWAADLGKYGTET